MSPPAPREPLRLDLEDIRCWLLEQIDGGEEVKGHDSMLSTYINTIDNALAALSSEIAEPRGCPTPGACSAVAELADLKQRILPQYLGRAQRAEKARQMAVAERDEMLEKLIVRQTTIANLHDVIDGMRGAARSARGETMSTTLDNSHTPGPWVWGDNYRGLYGSGGKENEVLQYAPYEGMWLGYVDGREANARLIAAAPELLEALIAMLEMHVSQHNHPIHANARRAIAKAEGK